MYQLRYANERTHVIQILDADGLGMALEDIGVRNSDVLLADAVVFVEAEGDRDALHAWSSRLGMNFRTKNISVRVMHGGTSSHAKIGSGVLQGVSERASAIPHLYVLDRDERGPKEISGMENALRERVHFLERRELENYLLVHSALRRYLRSRAGVDQTKLDTASDADLQSVIDAAAENQREHVLVKRMRAAIGGVRDKDVRRHIEQFVAIAHDECLATRIRTSAEGEFEKLFNASRLEEIVKQERKKLNQDWTPETRLSLAPGEEVLNAVFREFGVTYSKTEAPAIAATMEAGEIPQEVRNLIDRISRLPTGATDGN